VEFIHNKLTNVKNMHIQVLYGIRKVDMDVWVDIISRLNNFAKSQGCEKVIAESANPRVWEIAEVCGYKEQSRNLIFDL
jgi:hypothetical protein